eukprot:TRINITY_DN7725_c0_g1_i1.p1 TRINITY_DN7725_c0_g1~~TRINITY_DN7725_c0_g1_i1.p1  ORF type:complete len:690 (-),score=115.97 TRINITY_DN7725_c0_g1_i1:85-2130(-)
MFSPWDKKVDDTSAVVAHLQRIEELVQIWSRQYMTVFADVHDLCKSLAKEQESIRHTLGCMAVTLQQAESRDRATGCARDRAQLVTEAAAPPPPPPQPPLQSPPPAVPHQQIVQPLKKREMETSVSLSSTDLKLEHDDSATSPCPLLSHGLGSSITDSAEENEPVAEAPVAAAAAAAALAVPHRDARIIPHTAPWLPLWHWVFVLATTLQTAWIVLSLAIHFDAPTSTHSAFLAMEAVLTLVWVADLYIDFHRPFVGELQVLIDDDLSVIRRHYLRGWFIFDLLQSIPFDLVLLYGGQADGYRLFTFWRLFRVIRVRPAKFTRDPMKDFPKATFGALTFFWIVMFLHTTTCIWLGLKMHNEPEDEDDMPYPTSLSDTTNVLNVYSRALYYVITTMSTVGFGDITSHKLAGRIFTMVVQVLAVVMNVSLLGYALGPLLRPDEMAEVAAKKKAKLTAFMDFYDIPYHLQKQAYVIYPHILRAALMDTTEVIGELPSFLQEQIHAHVKLRLLSVVPMFRSLPRDLAHYLADCMPQDYIPPKSYVFQAGDKGTAMHFLVQGMVEVLSTEGGELVWEGNLKSGSYFGEAALLHDTTRSSSVRTVTTCVLYRLEKEEFRKVVRQFPEFREVLTLASSRPFAPRSGRRRPLSAITTRLQYFNDIFSVPRLSINTDFLARAAPRPLSKT